MTHVALALSGSSLAEAQSNRGMFGPQPAAVLTSPWRLEELRNFPRATLPWLAGELLAIMFVTTIRLLLNTTGVEIATKREADIERKLKAVPRHSRIRALRKPRAAVTFRAGTTVERSREGCGQIG